MAHSCITLPGTQLLLQFLAHSCTTILGTQLYYNPWHTAALQSLAHSCYYSSWHTAELQSLAHICITLPDTQLLSQFSAHSCITILGTQLYKPWHTAVSNPWHTALLQSLAHRCITILKRSKQNSFRESGSGNKPLFFNECVSWYSMYLQDGADEPTTWPLTWWWWVQLRCVNITLSCRVTDTRDGPGFVERYQDTSNTHVYKAKLVRNRRGDFNLGEP
jgi:hypothetical protein